MGLLYRDAYYLAARHRMTIRTSLTGNEHDLETIIAKTVQAPSATSRRGWTWPVMSLLEAG